MPINQESPLSMVSLSFDDGRIDNYTIVLPVLRRLHLQATFNICTGYILKAKDCEAFTDTEPMTVEMVREIFTDKNMEIASHGHRHEPYMQDLSEGIDRLRQIVEAENLCNGYNGIAVPHNRLSHSEWEKLNAIMREKKVRYVRKSIRNGQHGEWRSWCRKISRLCPSTPLYLMAHAKTLMDDEKNGSLIYSVPVMASTPPRCVISLINMAIKKGKHLVLQFHSIGDNPSSNDPLTYNAMSFDVIASHLAKKQEKGDLKVVTTMEMAFHICHYK